MPEQLLDAISMVKVTTAKLDTRRLAKLACEAYSAHIIFCGGSLRPAARLKARNATGFTSDSIALVLASFMELVTLKDCDWLLLFFFQERF